MSRSLPPSPVPIGGSLHRPYRRWGGIALGFGVPYLASRVIGPWADPLVPTVLGVALMASLAARRSLVTTMVARRAADGAKPSIDIASPRVRRVLSRLTVLWGVASLLQAAFLVMLVATHAAHLGAINTATSIGVPAALVAVTVAYVRHSARSAGMR